MRAFDTPDIGHLVIAIDTDGIAAHEAEVAALVSRARRGGVNPVVTDVLASPVSPEPARLRALGRVVMALAAQPERPDAALSA